MIFVCILAGFFLAAFAQILRGAMPLSPDDFRPNLSIVTFCMFALPLLPMFNLMAIPIPFMVLLVLGGKVWLLLVAVPMVYLIAVLAEAADRPVAILLLFLWIACLGS
ncbi:MAG: hypothetical protein GY927_07225 [bacterium]|nr:hypothetical protein [bacterium]